MPHQDETSLNLRLCTAILRLAHATRGMLLQASRSSGLPSTQMQALLLLAATPKELTPGALAESFGCTPATVSDVLNGLERRGLVTRTTDRDDRRHVLVSITEPGRSFVHQYAGWDRALDAAVGTLSLVERAGLYGPLLTLLAALDTEGTITAAVCPACAHLQRDTDGDAHVCRLSNLCMTPIEMRIDCPDFQRRTGLVSLS